MRDTEVTQQILEDEFCGAFSMVWDSQICLRLSPSVSADRQQGTWLAGVVWLGGSWTGSVTIAMPEEFAHTVTARALDVPLAGVSSHYTRDYIKELANMCAGNLKSSLPGESGLAIPGCFELRGPESADETFPLIVSLNFECEGFPVRAELRGL